MFVYLDNSSTTRQQDEVSDLMYKIMKEDFGNPSSLHKLGINAEKIIKKARKQVADSLRVSTSEIYFTSGGTESDNIAIFGSVYAKQRQGNHIITSRIEHPAVLNVFEQLEKEGFEVTYLPVDEYGKVKLEDYINAVTDNTIFTSVMTVNNEVGSIQPIEQMYANRKKSIFHTDAVQAYGKTELPNVDLLSICGHKIHGPKGVGAIYISKNTNVRQHIFGGGQEKNIRSGTENVPAIAGFGLASEMILNAKWTDTKEYLRNGLESEIKDIKINSPSDGVASILNISFLGTRSEVILHTLEQNQIYVSSGSACSSGKKGGSHVLKAMGLKNEEISSAIRFSLNPYNTKEEMDFVIDKTKDAVDKFRKLGSFR